MTDVRVKICGFTRQADLEHAIAAGADAVGLVFAASPRRLEPGAAQALARCVPENVIRVGLFMNQTRAEVQSVLDQVPLDWLQFHGDEDNAFCARFGLPFLKAVSMSIDDPGAVALSFPDAGGILLDSHDPGGAGGTGRTFDWGRRVATDKPLWLAGGLDPDNVAAAVARFQPYAVDVSSGVEQAPGIKDPDRVRRFIANAKQVDHEPAIPGPARPGKV
jgi:phosphoribosylanthranilate isomerase